MPEVQTAARSEEVQEKHIQLDEALGNIRSVLQRACELRERIAGEGSVKEKTAADAPQAVPSLARVLDQSPSEIRNMCKSIHEVLNEIQDLLF